MLKAALFLMLGVLQIQAWEYNSEKKLISLDLKAKYGVTADK